jgi:hypothetical protein
MPKWLRKNIWMNLRISLLYAWCQKNLKNLLAFSYKYCSYPLLRLTDDLILNHFKYDSITFKLYQCEPKANIHLTFEFLLNQWLTCEDNKRTRAGRK